MRAPPSSLARAPAPLQYLLLLCSAASVGASEPPVPPAGTPRYCKPLDLSKPCNVECDGPPGGDLPIYQFDLTPFQTKLQLDNDYGPYVPAGENYYTMPCMALTAVTCRQKSTSAAVQYFGPPEPPGHFSDECASLGEFNWDNCTLTETAGKFGLLCGFVHGDAVGSGARRVDIIYACAPGNPTVQGQEFPPNSGQYVITFSGAAACGVLWVKPPSPPSRVISCVVGVAILLLAIGLAVGGLVVHLHRRRTATRAMTSHPVEVATSAAPFYDMQPNTAFLSATQPSTAINTVPGLPVFGLDGKPIINTVPVTTPVFGLDGKPIQI